MSNKVLSCQYLGQSILDSIDGLNVISNELENLSPYLITLMIGIFRKVPDLAQFCQIISAFFRIPLIHCAKVNSLFSCQSRSPSENFNDLCYGISQVRTL